MEATLADWLHPAGYIPNKMATETRKQDLNHRKRAKAQQEHRIPK